MKLRPLIHRLLCPVVTACLLSCGVSALRAQATWDAGGSATNLNWSTLLNWSTDANVSGVAVTFGSAGLLAAGTTSSIVDTSLSITSLTFNYISTTTQHTLQINSGATLTETGAFTLGYAGTGTTKLTVTGAGSWVINAASSNFTVANTSSSVGSTTNTLTLDMSGLSTFSATVSQFNLGTGNDQGPFQVSLAKSSTITAATMRIGGAAGTGTTTGSNLLLGQTTVINAGTIMLATGRTSATMKFQTGLTSPTLKIRDQAGTGRANLIIGSNAATTVYASVQGGSSSPSGVLDLTGGTVDFLLNDLVLGLAQTADNGNGVGYGLGTMTFNSGTIDATNVVLGRTMDISSTSATSNTAGTNATATHATLNMQGGTLLAGTIVIAENQDSSANNTSTSGTYTRNPNSKGVFNLSGGAATVTGDVVLGTHTSATPGSGYADATLNITGGSLTVGGNLTEGATGNNVSTLVLNGGTLDLTAGYINVDTFTAQSGTLKNVLEIYNGALTVGAWTKSGTGTLILDGSNTFSAATLISAGVLQVGTGGTTGTLGAGKVTIGASGTLTFNRSDDYTVANLLEGSGNVKKSGTGRTFITGTNTLSGSTVEVSEGTLVVTNAAGLGTSPAISVASGAGLYFITPGTTGATLNTAASLTLVSGSKIGVGIGDTLATSALTASGLVRLNVFAKTGLSPDGTYTFLTSSSGGITNATYDLKFYGLSNALLTSVTTTSTSITGTFMSVGAENLTAMYWVGGMTGEETVWAVSNGLLTGGQSNWSFDRGGQYVYGIVPGETTDVIFAANGANTTYMQNTTLGYDMRIRTLSVDGQASGSAGTSAVVVNDSLYSLTLTGGDSSTSTPTIYVSYLTGGLTLNNDVVLESALPLLTVGMTDGTQLGLGTLTISGELSGNAFTKRGAGTLTLSGTTANTFVGTTKIEQGTLILGKTAGVTAVSGSELFIGESTLSATGLYASVVLNADQQIADGVDVTIYTGSKLDLNGRNETIGALSGAGSVTSNAVGTGTLTVGSGGESSSFSGVISNGTTTGTMITALTKTGAGTLTLSGTNTYTGITSILQGTLLYGASNVISTGAVTVNGSTAVWDLNGYTDTVGQVTVAGGGQIIGSGSSITSTSTYLMQSGTVSVVLAGTGGLTKSTDGLVILSGNNTYTGATVVSGGVNSILRITSGTALGSTAGTTTISGNTGQLSRLELAGDIVVNENVTLEARQSDGIAAAAISNYSGNNVWAGTITFTTGGSYYNLASESGTLTITGQISGGATTGTGRYLQLFGASEGIISGSIINGTGGASVNVVKSGAGTWTLSGVNSYTGSTAVNAGILRATNKNALGSTSSLSVANGATFQYQTGATGNTLTVGALSLATGSRVGVELGSAIASTGAATTTGSITLDVNGVSGFTYLTQQYNVITAASGLNNATYTLGKLYNITNFKINSLGVTSTAVYLDVTAAAELSVAYWKGGFSASDGAVWAITDGSTKSNWASDAAGTDTSLTPGADTQLIFSATGAVQQAAPMTLGFSMKVGSLTFNTSDTVWLQDLNDSLTLNRADAITVNAGAGQITLDTSVVFNNAAAVVSVASGGQLYLTRVRGNAFTKTGSGTLTLSGNLANDFTGTLKVYGGTVYLAKTAGLAAVSGNLEVGDTSGSTALVQLSASEQIVNTSDVTVNSGGTLDLYGFNETIDGLNGSGVVISNSAAATLTVGSGNEASAVFSGVLKNGTSGSVLSLVKTGTGTQTLSGKSTYTGTTAINQGTLIIGTTNALPTTGAVTIGSGTTVGRLELNSYSQTVDSLVFASNTATANEVVIGKGQKLSITGTTGLDLGTGSSNAAMTTNATFSGGGDLVVSNTSANLELGIAYATINSGSTHAAALNLAALGSFVANVNELRLGYGSLTTGTLTLSNTYNAITATTTHVGSSAGSNAGTVSTLYFGTGTNILKTDTLNIGVSKALGTVVASASGGRVTIGGKTGSTTITVGSTAGTGTASTPTGILDLRGMTATVTAGVLTIGKRDGTDAGGATGTVYFDGGTFTANSVVMAAKTNAGTGAATATLNISNGVFTVNSGGSFTLASQSGSGTASGTLNITGGKLVSNVDIKDGGGTATSTINLNGGTLDMTGHNIGDGTNNIDAVNLLAGTLKNVAQINGGATALTKTGTGTLYLAGTNSYTGATVASAGTLWARSNTALQGTASLTVKSGASFRYTSAVIGNNLTLNSGATLTLESGSTVGVELGNRIIVQGAASTTGSVTLDVFGVAGATYAAGQYTVISATSGLSGASYVLGNYYNLSGYTVTGVGSSSTEVWLNVATATALTEAYWKGGYSGGANVWAISDGSSTSNWTTDSAGTSATGQVAGANTKVIFSATGASNQTDMRLGTDMAVGSLEFNNTTVAALNDLDNKLTVNGASAVSVTSTGAVTLNTNLVLANSQATVNVANAAGVLNLQGTVTGNGLTKTGSGRLAVSGTQSFSGSVLLNAGTTYFGGTTTVNSLTLASGARLEGSGAVTSVTGMTFGGTLAVGDESLSSAVASTLTLASGSGTLTFQTGSVITLDLVNGAGTGGGESDVLAISGTLVIGSNVSLQVETNNMTTWAIGDTWQLIDWTGLTSRTGTFVTTELDSALSGTGLSWDYSNLYTTGAITLSAVPEPSRAGLVLLALGAMVVRRRKRSAPTGLKYGKQP